MAKEHYSLLKKMATVLGLFAIAMFIIGAASSNDNRNDGGALIEAAPSAATSTTATTTEETAAKPVIPDVETFSFNAVDETVTAGGKTVPVKVDKQFFGDDIPIKFTAKAVIDGKTVLLSGEIPTIVAGTVIAQFKNVSGTQVTKFDKGFVTATIE